MISESVPRISAVLLLFAANSSFAQSPADKAAAESLFREGRELLARNNFTAACPKLAESQRLDPGVGTLLYLADCFEKDGKTASAWAIFQEAAALAQTTKQVERERIARERATSLEPRLGKVSLDVKDGKVVGLLITRDGLVVPRAQWGSALAVDPGEHVVEANAPGHHAWKGKFALKEGVTVVVNVPVLEPVAEAPPPASSAPPLATPPPSSPPPGLPPENTLPKKKDTVAYALLGVGGVGVVIGSIFGAKTFSSVGASKDNCEGSVCNKRGVEQMSAARTSGWISTGGFVLGTGAVVAGAILLFRKPEAGAWLQPTVGPSSAGLFVKGIYQ